MLALALLGGCATYGERVAPVTLPGSEAEHVDVDGAKVMAYALTDPAAASKALGFDARGAGLLPLRFVLDNQSGGEVRVQPSQTFLIDEQGQAWPLLTAEQAQRRVKSHVEIGETAKGTGTSAVLLGAAGALVGGAIAIVTGHDAGELIGKGAGVGAIAGALYGGTRRNQELDSRIRSDLRQQSFHNERIRAGELAYGYLFFPGKDEAESANALRLALEVRGTQRVVTVPLKG